MELLSPARDFASLNAAIKNGADSVYLGISGYNLRAHTTQFQPEDLKPAVELCHDSAVELYVCTNAIMKDKDLKTLKNVMPTIKSAGADAIIASDLGVLNVALENDMTVHMSVQANISNLEALKLLKELGVSRVILSRELSLDEIRKIKDKSPMEVEVFIHGAMCMAVSGRCFLSSHLYGKSANCGECLQPCRESWELVATAQKGLKLDLEGQNKFETDSDPENWASHQGKEFELEQEQGQSRILSPKDLCMIEHIPELIEAGIDSFKIEGRARPADYVATATRTYREAIKRYENGEWEFDPGWLLDLKKVFNRGFDTGFYFKTPYESGGYNESTHIKRDIGSVCNYYKNVSAAEIRLWDDLRVGDEIIITGKTTGSLVQKVKSLQIEGKDVKEVQKGQNVGIFVEGKVRANDVVYKRLPRIEL